MTEWADTEMKVYGKREDLERFKNDVAEDGASEEENSVFSFNKITPMPEDVSAWDKEGKGEGWYYWQEEHWGVKWGTRYAFLRDRWMYLQYTFDNPWGAPLPIFNALIERYPKLNFDIITRDYEYEIDLELKSKKGKITLFNGPTELEYIENFETKETKYVEITFSKSGKSLIIPNFSYKK